MQCSKGMACQFNSQFGRLVEVLTEVLRLTIQCLGSRKHTTTRLSVHGVWSPLFPIKLFSDLLLRALLPLQPFPVCPLGPGSRHWPLWWAQSDTQAGLTKSAGHSHPQSESRRLCCLGLAVWPQPHQHLPALETGSWGKLTPLQQDPSSRRAPWSPS